MLADQRQAEQQDEDAVALLLQLVDGSINQNSSPDSPAATLARWAVKTQQGGLQRTPTILEKTAQLAELQRQQRPGRSSLHRAGAAQGAYKVGHADTAAELSDWCSSMQDSLMWLPPQASHPCWLMQ